MSKDYQDVAYRIAVESDIVRVYPNAPWIIYAAGTLTPVVASGTADADGIINIETLATGQYDLHVDGMLRKSFHHIKTDYVQKHAQTWKVFIPGSITSDVNENNAHEIYFTAAAGKILKVRVIVQHADATANATIHILKGAPSGGAALAFATDSIWSVQCNPQSAVYRWSHPETVSLAIEAQKNITIGIDWVAGTIEGVTVLMVFKED